MTPREIISPAAPAAADPRQSARAVWVIAALFVLLAGWLAFGSPGAHIPVSPAQTPPKAELQPGPRREPMREPPSIAMGGFTHSCNECHRLFESSTAPKQQMMQHAHVRLNHGMNDKCLNCHDRENRERLVLFDGTLVGFDRVTDLCSRCHGTVYRDWERGTHGKTLGSWDARSGDQRRLTCTECHDPHAPAYPPLVPLAAPDTLRMGNQSAPLDHHDASPLRRERLAAPRGNTAGGHS